MKKITFLFIAYFIIQASKAQDTVSVEKSLIGVSVSPFGSLFFNYENKLSKEWTLASKIGVDYSYSSSRKGYIIKPFLSIEPRWYYNIDRRARLDKNIKFNTGNYWSLEVNYFPKSLIASNRPSYSLENIIYFLPSYGMRRTISKKLYFDGSLYAGYSLLYGYENRPVSNSEYNTFINGGYFHAGFKIRIGLNFKTNK